MALMGSGPGKKGIYNTAGPVKRTMVAYGTPEYEKAYKEGRIASYDAETGMYIMQDLPGVVVEGERIVGRRNPFENIDVKGTALAAADVATDIMQLGSFIPHPFAQAVGRIGGVAGMALDGYQAAESAADGDYLDAAINAGSAVAGGLIGRGTFRRNPKFIPENTIFGKMVRSSGKRTPYLNVDKQVKKQTKGELAANRALLGTVAGETVYDDVSMNKKKGDKKNGKGK